MKGNTADRILPSFRSEAFSLHCDESAALSQPTLLLSVPLLLLSLSPPVTQTDLASLYIKAGVKNIGTVFLMTDAQVADEKFLVLVNDLLASGNSRRR